MKKYLQILPVFFFFFLSFPTFASHVVGGDVEYECIGPRQWKIRLTIYRDCSGVALCSSANCPQPMVARPSTTLNPPGCSATPNNVNFTLSLIKVEDIGKGEVAICGNAAKNGCNNLNTVTPGPLTPSIEKYVFEGNLNLNLPSLNSSNCSYWDVYWELCCRSAGIANLQGSSGQSFRIGCTINIFNRSSSPCVNNSPIIKNEPVVIVNTGQEYTLNFGAVDPDGDSLTYQIDPALQQGGGTVVYQTPFGANYPFPLNSAAPPHVNYPQPNGPYVLIDTFYGDISFNPVNNTSSLIFGNLNIRVKQWMYDANGNPVLAGVTQREILIYLINSPSNNPPGFSTNPILPGNKPKYNYSVCEGEQICFTVTAKDTDIYPSMPRFDTTYISWNQGIVRPGKLSFGPTYPVGVGLSRPREDSWQFCWQTESGDGRTLPYYFTVSATDNFCPRVGKVTKAFRINVIPSPQGFSTKTDLGCGKQVFKVIKTNPKQTFTSAILEIALLPNDWNFSLGKRTILCSNPNPAAIGPINDPRPLIIDTFNYTSMGKYLVKYTLAVSGPQIGTYCTKVYFDTISVLSDSIVSPNINIIRDTIFCIGDSVILSSQIVNSKFRYQWYRNNSAIPNVTNPSFVIKTSGAYKLKIIDTIFGCSNYSKTINVLVNPLPVANFTSSKSCIFTNKQHIFWDKTTISSGYTARKWYFGPNDIDTNKNVARSYSSKGSIVVKLLAISNYGCKDSITNTFQIDTALAIALAPGYSFCTPDTATLFVTNYPNYTYKWRKNNFLIPNANNSSYPVTTGGYYSVIYQNLTNNCIDTIGDYPINTFNPKPIPLFSNSANNVCLPNNLITFTDNSTISSGSFTRVWDFGDGTTSTINQVNKSYNSAGNYTVKLKLTSSAGCKDSTTRTINIVSPLNGAITTNSNTSFCSGKSIQLSASNYPGASYFWFKNNSLLGGSSTNVLNVSEQGNYKLVLDNGQNCKDTSNTISVVVYPKPIVGFTVNNNVQCILGNQFVLNDTSSIIGGTYNRTWAWENTVSSQPNLAISFTNPGTYPVKLKSISNNGCTDSITKILTVLPKPTIGAIAGPTSGLSTQLTYDYNLNQQLNHTYNWIVTNGNIVSGQGTNAIKVQWLSSGNGQIKATISNGAGCSDSTSLSVNIIILPIISSFTPQSGTNGTAVTIIGNNFINVTSVKFGGVNAKNFTTVTPTVISALVDTGATGNVTVVTPNGTALLSGFTYTTNTGLTEFISQAYTIFPNPINSEIIIESNKPLNETLFELVDMNGKVLLDKVCNESKVRFTIDVKNISQGLYLLRIKSKGQLNTVKIVKQ